MNQQLENNETNFNKSNTLVMQHAQETDVWRWTFICLTELL